MLKIPIILVIILIIWIKILILLIIFTFTNIINKLIKISLTRHNIISSNFIYEYKFVGITHGHRSC